jgi:hypothetical protein
LNVAALDAVAARLREHDVPFLLGGSGLLHALGIDVPVRDIDLMLRAEDRERFEAAAGDWLETVTTDAGPVLTSAWKATLDVDGCEVEGLGGLGFAGGPVLPFRAGGTWRGVPLAARPRGHARAVRACRGPGAHPVRTRTSALTAGA